MINRLKRKVQRFHTHFDVNICCFKLKRTIFGFWTIDQILGKSLGALKKNVMCIL